MRTSHAVAALAAVVPLALFVAAPTLSQGGAAPAPTPAASAVDATSALPAVEIPTEDVTMLRLRDGSFVWGAIRAHDPESLTFARLDHGGVATVPWSLLDPRQSEELRTSYGYVDRSSDEVMVDAERLILTDGREVVGKVLDRTGDALLVKTAGATIPVPKSRIAAAATTVRVPALEIYTREELYDQALSDTPPDDPAAQYALAQYCESVLDFAHAVEHYEAVRALDASFRPADVEPALARAARKAEQQEQIDYLAEVDLLSARRKFDEALQRAEAFSEVYPDSPLLPDARRKVERVEAARERALGELVGKSWHRAASNRARKLVSKSLEEVLAYLDEEMPEAVFNDVVEAAREVQADVEPETVRRVWQEREGGRWRRASYGYGTWLLGEDRALAGLEEEEEQAAQPVTEKDRERAELEERYRRFLQNQELQRRSRASGGEEAEERELAWRELTGGARQSWILAYYAESSGDMEVRQPPRFRACRECGGKGVREVINSGGARTQRNTANARPGSGLSKIKCPTCKGFGLVRRVDYR